MIYRRVVTAIGLFLAAFGGRAVEASPSKPPMPPEADIAAIWSQIIGYQAGAQPADAFAPLVVEVRFILPGDQRTCAEYDIWYRTTATGNWLKNTEQASERTHNIGDFEVSKTDFPMTLCRYSLAADWFEVGVSDLGAQFKPLTVWSPVGKKVTTTVAGPASVGRRNDRVDQIVMITIGDTGCRGMPPGAKGRMSQDCSTDWKFPDLMDNAGSVKLDNGEQAQPDLFVHVGDYRYFWEATSPDSMGYWLKEFLSPAQQALSIAPWSLSRGNHETCPTSGPHWFGKGWYYLFGDVDWPSQPCANLVPTRYFDIGPDGGIDLQTRHRVVMVDDSNPSSPGADGRDLTDLYKDAVGVSVNGDNQAHVASTHWVSHIAGIVYMDYCGGQCGGENGQILQDVYESFSEIQPCLDRGPGVPACVPSTLLRGHEHYFEHIRLFRNPEEHSDWAWPQTYIVGHGGTKSDSFSFSPGRCVADIKVPNSNSGASYKGHVWADPRHGFVAWRRAKDTLSDPAGWAATYFWYPAPNTTPDPAPLPECVLK